MSKIILVVEDDQTIRELYTEVLEGEGYTVMSAQNGVEAMEILKSHRTDLPSLILTDFMMPVMDGLQLVNELKNDENWVSLPVMMVSASKEKPRGVHGFEFIRKPFDLESMVKRVNHYCSDKHIVA